MVHVYRVNNGLLQNLNGLGDVASSKEGIWIDLIQPTKEEESSIEAIIGVDIPTREEMREVESSSQLYRDGDAAVMTIRILQEQTARTSSSLIAATFILTPSRLVTLRYSELPSFKNFLDRAVKEHGCANSSTAAMVGLLDGIVGDVADTLERVGDQLDEVSSKLFAHPQTDTERGIVDKNLQRVLKTIGQNGDLASRCRESLHSISRVLTALRTEQAFHADPELKKTFGVVRKDVQSLLEHDAYVSTKVQFLLDSALGLINIQQNAIIKIFSVAAVIFLPPTLIASLYGMNFEHMPELKWHFGYPFALMMMVISAILPYWYFKRRGWL
jgi:magnesium transporter